METTHRERKKQQTRQAFVSCACELFAQKGYGATTIAEIAERANCAPRTFFQYFDSKDDLLLVGIDEFWDDFAKSLHERPADTTALQATQDWMVTTTKEYLAGEYPLMQMLDREDTNLKVAVLARAKLCSMERMAAVLAPEIAKDLKMSSEATEPKLIASAAAAMLDMYQTDTAFACTDPLQFIKKVFQLLSGTVKAVQKP